MICKKQLKNFHSTLKSVVLLLIISCGNSIEKEFFHTRPILGLKNGAF